MSTVAAEAAPDWKKAIGAKIRTAREKAGMRLDDLAFKLREYYPDGEALSVWVLGRYERGEFKEFPTRLAWALVQVPELNLDLEDLVSVGSGYGGSLRMGRKRKSAGQGRRPPVLLTA